MAMLNPINSAIHREDRRTSLLGSQYMDWQFWLTNNSTSTALSSSAPTITKPAQTDESADPSSNKIAFSTPDSLRLIIQPFGTDAANETFVFRVNGWQKSTANTNALYTPMLLFQGTVTLHTPPGVSGEKPDNNDLLSDDIAQSDGISANAINNTVIGSFVDLDHLGSPIIEIEFDLTGAASANCLVKTI